MAVNKIFLLGVINDDCDADISSTIHILDDISVSLLAKYITPTLLRLKYIFSRIKDIISLQTKGYFKKNMVLNHSKTETPPSYKEEENL